MLLEHAFLLCIYVPTLTASNITILKDQIKPMHIKALLKIQNLNIA